jgi:hypothetical protein
VDHSALRTTFPVFLPIMTTPTSQTKTKGSAEHIDTISVTDNHPDKPRYEELDRFGASLVKDAAEVALVKKLDRYMMVSVLMKK